MKFPQRGIYAILDADSVPTHQRVVSAQAALAGGVGMLQYRDKGSDETTRLKHTVALVQICREYDTPLIINDNVALAQETGAHGVHLGQSDAAITDARAALGPQAIIGATCHANLDAAAEAANQGADYVSFGRFFDSRTKPEAPPADPTVLEQAHKVVTLPVVAIGGVNADNGRSLINAGADWLAIAGALFNADDIEAAARNLGALYADANNR